METLDKSIPFVRDVCFDCHPVVQEGQLEIQLLQYVYLGSNQFSLVGKSTLIDHLADELVLPLAKATHLKLDGEREAGKCLHRCDLNHAVHLLQPLKNSNGHEVDA